MKTKDDVIGFRYDILFYVVTAAYFLFLLNATARFSPRAALTPNVALFVGLLLCGIGLVKILFVPAGLIEGWSADPRSLAEAVDADLATDGSESESGPFSFPIRVVIYVVATIVFIFSVVLVGFFSSMAVFIFSHAYLRGKGLVKSTAAAVLLPAMFYVVFIVVLERSLILRYGILF